MSSQQWFIVRGEQETGPLTEDEILVAALSGVIQIGDFVKATDAFEPVGARSILNRAAWQFLRVERQEGPFDVVELKERILTGRIEKVDLLRRSDKYKWDHASSISGIKELFTPTVAGYLEGDDANQLIQSSKWYWLNESDKVGPETTSIIREMIDNEDLADEDLLFHPVQNLWMPVKSFCNTERDRLPSTVPSANRQCSLAAAFFGSTPILLYTVKIEAHLGAVSCVTFSPDGKTLATGGFDHCVRLWNIRNREQVGSLCPDYDAVSNVAFSQDGTELASGSSHGLIRIWDIESEQERHLLKGHEGAVSCMAYLSGSGNWSEGIKGIFDTFLLSAGVDGTLRIWNTTTGKEAKVISGLGSVRHFCLDPDGNHIWLALTPRQNPPHYFMFCDLRTDAAKVIRQIGGICQVAASRNKRYVAVSSVNGRLRVWDIEKKVYENPHHSWQSQQKELTAMTFSTDSHLLASGGSDGTVMLWNPVRKQLLGTCDGHEGAVLDVAFSPNGHWLAACGNSNKVLLWDVSQFRECTTSGIPQIHLNTPV